MRIKLLIATAAIPFFQTYAETQIPPYYNEKTSKCDSASDFQQILPSPEAKFKVIACGTKAMNQEDNNLSALISLSNLVILKSENGVVKKLYYADESGFPRAVKVYNGALSLQEYYRESGSISKQLPLPMVREYKCSKSSCTEVKACTSSQFKSGVESLTPQNCSSLEYQALAGSEKAASTFVQKCADFDIHPFVKDYLAICLTKSKIKNSK